jgi:hypothetical protein
VFGGATNAWKWGILVIMGIMGPNLRGELIWKSEIFREGARGMSTDESEQVR